MKFYREVKSPIRVFSPRYLHNLTSLNLMQQRNCAFFAIVASCSRLRMLYWPKNSVSLSVLKSTGHLTTFYGSISWRMHQFVRLTCHYAELTLKLLKLTRHGMPVSLCSRLCR